MNLNQKTSILLDVLQKLITKMILVPPGGALWNPETQERLRSLTDVLETARARPEKGSPATEGFVRRPGWARHLVLDVLRSATEPLSASEVRRAIQTRTGEVVNLDTVRWVLQMSRAARTGQIVVRDPGKYARYVYVHNREARPDSPTRVPKGAQETNADSALTQSAFPVSCDLT